MTKMASNDAGPVVWALGVFSIFLVFPNFFLVFSVSSYVG